MSGNVKAASASDDWAHWYHQWGSLINWRSTQVNSTGVPWVMYVLGFIYDTGTRTDQAMLRVAANGK